MVGNLPHLQNVPPLAQAIADKFGALPQVVAVALAGSRTTGAANEASDYDFYVYIRDEIPVNVREAIAREFAQRLEINNQFWEPGDEWIDSNSGCGVDVMYRTPQWIEEQLDRVLVHHQASVGYSTCFWWNVLTSASLYDSSGWFKQLQEKANQPYPEPLKQAIVAKNHPILRRNISSYTHQLELAINRDDSISVMHRTVALLGSLSHVCSRLTRKNPTATRSSSTAACDVARVSNPVSATGRWLHSPDEVSRWRGSTDVSFAQTWTGC